MLIEQEVTKLDILFSLLTHINLLYSILTGARLENAHHPARPRPTLPDLQSYDPGTSTASFRLNSLAYSFVSVRFRYQGVCGLRQQRTKGR